MPQMVTSLSRDASSSDSPTYLAPRRRESAIPALNRQFQHFKDTSPLELVSFFLIDLDNFKLINELCGYSGGDQVIDTVLNRCANLHPHLHIIHLGADEFIGLYAAPDCDEKSIHSTVDALVTKLLSSISQPISLSSHIIHLTASVGIFNKPSNALAAEELLRSAAIALKHAKTDSGNSFSHFLPDMWDSIAKRAILEEELRSGLLRGEIVPFYQPIVSLASRKTTHFEALVRWQHPIRGILTPGHFLNLAQEANLDDDLLFTILHQTCSEARSWDSAYALSVNMSPAQVCNPSIALRLIQTVFASGLSPDRLMIEITESAVLNDIASAQNTISMLHKAGIKIALDDFGTGYASLSRICNLPLDMLKIDQSLIQAMDSSNGCKLVKAVIDLGCSLGMPVVSEGIETPEQADILTEMGCEFGQGYWFGRPAPMAHI